MSSGIRHLKQLTSVEITIKVELETTVVEVFENKV